MSRPVEFNNEYLKQSGNFIARWDPLHWQQITRKSPQWHELLPLCRCKWVRSLCSTLSAALQSIYPGCCRKGRSAAAAMRACRCRFYAYVFSQCIGIVAHVPGGAGVAFMASLPCCGCPSGSPSIPWKHQFRKIIFDAPWLSPTPRFSFHLWKYYTYMLITLCFVWFQMSIKLIMEVKSFWRNLGN